MSNLDSRLHAFRTDLADIRLKGIVEAMRFTEGDIRQLIAPITPVHREPQADSMQTTQALMGETCRVFEEHEGWAWVQLETDGYVGYMVTSSLATELYEPTHRVCVPVTFIYPAPNIKSQPVTLIPMNARIAVADRGDRFARLKVGGYVIAAHLRAVKQAEADFVAVAGFFRNIPYLWGGKSAAGLDCSGLLQLSLEAAGRACPRDTDMQERDLGQPLRINDLDSLKRGDLVFWSGHVGIMADGRDLIHANGHHMLVACEPLGDAARRIRAGGQEITAIKRFQ